MNATLPPAVLTQVLSRSKRLFWLKLAGISGFMWLFFVAYFHLLRQPARPVFEMPLTALDRWLPFQEWALPAYLSLWLYVGLAPGLMTRFRTLLSYGLWACVLCLAGLAFFYGWPTAIPAYTGPAPDAVLYRLLQGVDAAGNACPSMHVASACYTGLWLDRLLRAMGAAGTWRFGNGVWAGLIVYSTLAVKQHVALDVMAGALLGALMALAALRWSLAGREGIVDRTGEGMAPASCGVPVRNC